jgi:hypothetical protein
MVLQRAGLQRETVLNPDFHPPRSHVACQRGTAIVTSTIVRLFRRRLRCLILRCLIHYMSTDSAGPLMSRLDRPILRTCPHHGFSTPLSKSHMSSLIHAKRKPPHPSLSNSTLPLAYASARLPPEPQFETAQACKARHRRIAQPPCQCSQAA